MGIVAREGHFGLEVAAVVHGLLVEDDEGDAPLEDIVVDQLLAVRGRVWARAHRAYLDVGPLFFIQLPELVHEHTLRCFRHGVSGVGGLVVRGVGGLWWWRWRRRGRKAISGGGLARRRADRERGGGRDRVREECK